MVKILLSALPLFLFFSTARAAVPVAPGWYDVPNTHLRDVAPPDNLGNSGYEFHYYVKYLVEAWNSAVFDTRRNRLVMWGGGHNNYWGNEFYALGLGDLKLQRLNDPSTVFSDCNAVYPDGKPSSRHIYDGMAYLENVDRVFIYGGSKSKCGYLGNDTWTFDLTTLTWQNMNPSGPNPGGVPGVVTAYDPNTQKVYLHDDRSLYAYSFQSNSYQKLTTTEYFIDYHMTAAIDPKRKKFIIIGTGNVYSYDIGAGSAYARQILSTTGGGAIVGSSSPGLAYDPVSDRMVAWNGGDAVYSLDLDTKAWSSVTYSGGPGAAPWEGVFNHFEYSPASNLFVVVNDVDANLKTFRLTTGSGTAVTGWKRPWENNITVSASPNPFRRSTRFSLNGSFAGTARLQVIGIDGRIVEDRSLSPEMQRHGVAWNVSHFSAGVYTVKVSAGGKTSAQRITLLK